MGVRKEGRKKEGRKVKEGKEEEQEKGKRLAPCLATNLSKSSHFEFKQGRLWKNVGIRVAHIGPLSPRNKPSVQSEPHTDSGMRSVSQHGFGGPHPTPSCWLLGPISSPVSARW